MSVQYKAVASQKITWPCLTVADAAATEAVSVIMLAALTVLT
jgi:hypothetical protein